VRAYTVFASGGKRIDPVFISEVRDRHGSLLAENVTLIGRRFAEPEVEPAPEPGELVADAPGPGAAPAVELEATEPELDPSEAVETEIGLPELEEERLAERALEEAMRRIGASVDEIDAERGAVPPVPEGHAIDPGTAYLMSDLLEAAVQEGTGQRLRALGRPVAGKTGTTNDLFDAWFIGFTPGLAVGTWVGYDEPRHLGRFETGSRTASPIVLDYLRRALAGVPPRAFEPPPGVAFVRIDKASGLLPCGFETIFQPFLEGTAPQEACSASVSSEGEERGSARPLRLD